ncbi:uncharacterized protein LOC106881742 [Octopus bimaculoides]|uniref:uncharacterized protein LOC106881742 n=1 Tax=Octopus bimaculoides TaxID=37653 RepID=UPI00071DEAE3|nr:uncharacterized protein LOC106881742 [Octopus bimaculoides]|eukprot:XP_014787719.1 PREDICTED: uncharacterized protein LOC106881742 [Octopus bimaculoides]
MSKQSKTKRKKMSEPRTPKVFDSKFYHALRPRKISIRDIKVYPMKPLVPAECPSDSLSLSKSEETLLATKDYYKGQKHSGYYDFVKNTRTDRNRYICKRLVRRLCFFIKAMREEKNAIMLAKYASYVSKLKPRSAGSAFISML